MGLSPAETRAMSLADFEACVSAFNRAHGGGEGKPEHLDAATRDRLRAALEAVQ
jgi:hypothetical protein